MRKVIENSIEKSKWWIFNKITNLWIALSAFTILQQPASADWIKAEKEKNCFIYKTIENSYKKTTIPRKKIKTNIQNILSCEWWTAYTTNYGYNKSWKSVKYDTNWNPQKCECKIIRDKTVIYLDDWKK